MHSANADFLRQTQSGMNASSLHHLHQVGLILDAQRVSWGAIGALACHLFEFERLPLRLVAIEDLLALKLDSKACKYTAYEP